MFGRELIVFDGRKSKCLRLARVNWAPVRGHAWQLPSFASGLFVCCVAVTVCVFRRPGYDYFGYLLICYYSDRKEKKINGLTSP